MTCIIGFNDRKNGKLFMMGDSLGVGGLDVVLRDDPKVFHNDEFLIGYTTSFRMGQLLRFANFPTQKLEQDDYQYMCTDFIDYVLELFENKKYSRSSEGKHSGGNFLVGYRGVLYEISSDFQVGIPSDQFASVGCGESYAHGAIEVLKDEYKDVEVILKKAMDVVVKRSAGVRPPYVTEVQHYDVQNGYTCPSQNRFEEEVSAIKSNRNLSSRCKQYNDDKSKVNQLGDL